LFEGQRFALLQKFTHRISLFFKDVRELTASGGSVVHPEGCVLLQMCKTGAGQKNYVRRI